jgi:hypothetical protein
MITFPELGKWGRLGNQLFQMATTISLAMENGESYGFPRWPYESKFALSNCFHDQLPDGPEYREPRFSWDPIAHRMGLRLYGYFQSQQYFGKFAPLIRRLLSPRPTISRSKYLGIASVHVRRGDYLDKPDCHPPLPIEYYEKAARIMQRNGINEFLVFSDDPVWCRNNLTTGRRGWTMARHTNEVAHLAEMSACEAHIIANSSFSWWGAWLNPNTLKKVVAPKKWFGSTLAPTHAVWDLIPPTWVQI